MAVNLSLIGGAGWQFFDDSGLPLSGGKIYTYAAGTTTPLTTYTSRDGLTANANPIILDAAGRTPQQIWSTEGLLYKYVVAKSNDVQIRVWDNIGGSVVASNLSADLANTADNSKGDALIGFRQSNSSGFLTGATARTVNDKLQEFISVKDFGAVGDGTADDTTAIQNAISAATGRTLFFPSGVYLVTSLTIGVNTTIMGSNYNTTSIKRAPSAPTGTFINVTASQLSIQGMTIDGNKANVSNPAISVYVTSTVSKFEFISSRATSSKASAGYGQGILIDGDKTTTSVVISNSLVDNNDTFGCQIQSSYNSRITNNYFTLNGADGLYYDTLDQTFAQKDYDGTITGNIFTYNGQSGCHVGNYLANNNYSAPIFGITNEDTYRTSITGNVSAYNGYYGFICAGAYISCTGNVSNNNATAAAQTGGILGAGLNIVISGNTISDNTGFGVDAGGCFNGNISNNLVFRNDQGINLEGSVNVNVTGNTLISNGETLTAYGNYNIYVNKYGAATASTGFDIVTANITISGNHVYITGNSYGIGTGDNPEQVSIVDNTFYCANVANDKFRCIYHVANSGMIENNRIINSTHEVTIDGSNNLVVPDAEEFAAITNAGTVQSLWTSSQYNIGTGVAYLTITNPGSGYVTPPTVTFVGGTGSGATASAIINSQGLVTGLRVVGRGAYSVPPTVSISAPPIGVTATATVQWKLPLLPCKNIKLLSTSGNTVVTSGFTPINAPSSPATIAVPAQGIINFISMYSRWYLAGKTF